MRMYFVLKLKFCPKKSPQINSKKNTKMHEKVDKLLQTKSQSVANAVGQKKSNGNPSFEDNRKAIVQKKIEPTGNNSGVAQLGKKKRDLERAKKNNPNGLQHHNRPEYQEQNERQMELINQGVDKKDAKRQAKAEAKNK